MNNEINYPVVNEECPVMRHKIGQTTYIVKVHFNPAATETMSDKIKRLLRNEVINM